MRWAAAPGQPPAPRYVHPPPPPQAKKGGGCFRVVLALGALSFFFCCCILSVVAESAKDPLDWNSVVQNAPDVGGPRTNLGNALVPDDLPASDARHYAWKNRFLTFELGYGLSSDVHDEIEDNFQDLSRTWSYKPGEGTSFTWIPPEACRNREWACVFDSVTRDNGEYVKALTALFKARRDAEGLDARATTELVVTFVQNIKYRLPTEETAAFGLLPPAIVVSDGSGDCDSKALLATVILNQLGVDAVVLLASGLGHAALGVNVPTAYRKFGKKYSFVEVTTPGWPIGKVPPDYDIAGAWKVIPVAVQR
ncbi:MAG: hypothetical protein U0228_10245 [Myxococcaceae bacterium]